MTLRQAERITGLVIIRGDKDAKAQWFKVVSSLGARMFEVYESSDKDAAEEIVRKNYDQVGNIVLKRQKYRCAKCASRGPLSRHHKKLRSHGREDTVDNIEWVCNSCHESAHGIKKGK